MSFTLILTLLLACGTQPPTTVPASPEVEPTEAVSPPAPQLKPLPSFGLNDGERWQMDPHTRESMGRLLPLLRDGSVSGPEQAKHIDKELGVLVKGCTMTGPAHDELHVFLGALFPRVGALSKEPSADKLQKLRTDLNILASDYEGTFQ